MYWVTVVSLQRRQVKGRHEFGLQDLVCWDGGGLGVECGHELGKGVVSGRPEVCTGAQVGVGGHMCTLVPRHQLGRSHSQ